MADGREIGTKSHDRNALGLPNQAMVLLTPAEVAEITGLAAETLAQWRSQKRGIPYVKISRNCVRYRQSDLNDWLSERIVRTDQDALERR